MFNSWRVFPSLALLGLIRALNSRLGLACGRGSLTLITLYSMLVPVLSIVSRFFSRGQISWDLPSRPIVFTAQLDRWWFECRHDNCMEKLPGDKKNPSETHILKDLLLLLLLLLCGNWKESCCSLNFLPLKEACSIDWLIYLLFFYQKIILININDKSVKLLSTGEYTLALSATSSS